MKSPRKFITARRSRNKQKQIQASVIRVADMMGVSIKRDGGADSISVDKFRKMLRDAEVAGDMTLRKLLMIPMHRVVPADGDEKAKRSAEFIEAVEKRMPGSPISVYRDQALNEALESGMVIAELNFAKMEIPGFGMAQGIESITVANTEDFEGNTKLDEFGNVEYFRQIRNGSHNFTPDEVLYYGYKAISGNPEGVSALYAAYDPWLLKIEALLNVFISTSTSTTGLKIFKTPAEKYLEEKALALQVLNGLGRTANIVMPDDWSLDVRFPASANIYMLVKAISETGNKPIRKAILYDETITAEGMNSWNAGTSEESQNMVVATMKAEGDEFLESFVQEQIYRRILDENGMRDYPVPHAISVPMLEDKDPTAVLLALGTAKTNKIITGDLRPEEQDAIVKKLLYSIDIESQGLIPAAIVPPDDQNMLLAARTPKDRQKPAIKEEGVKLQEHEDEAAEALTETWKAIVPNISKNLISGLFDGDNWKTTNLGTIRELIESKIKTDGKKLRDTMSDAMFTEWTDTYDKTAKSLPSQKLHAALNVGINPVHAKQALRQRVYLMLEKTYGDMSADLYYMLENAVIGTTSPAAAQAQIQDYLLSKGINPGRATTLMNTALTHAHNSGKMAVYKPLEDPFGADPGSITGYQYVSTKGAFKEDICIGMENQFFRCNDSSMPNPPLHYGCSGSLVPVFAGEEPWQGGKFLDPSKSAELINAHGGVQSGFG